jgi:hypothetical protein
MKLKLKIAAAVLMFLASIVFPGCQKWKNSDLQITSITHSGSLSVEKQAKIERYISIVFGIDKDKITFDKQSNSFQYNGETTSAEEIEKLYDKSNEYKLKYE